MFVVVVVVLISTYKFYFVIYFVLFSLPLSRGGGGECMAIWR